ncbi:MAG TPA: lytic transglycosylase domain-containing protein [Verrucomicrobiota bacterium]|nr:hypothetical protein [Verrucomicrobiales bacterium]HRI13632.1 lytic transglycosylase domain-containing protein [Verrucomicrobiota bacterium]
MKPQSLRRFMRLMGGIPVLALAQTPQVNLNDLLRAGEEWAAENLDADKLQALADHFDHDEALKLLRGLQEQFEGQYVLDLARFRDTAQTLLPLLETLPQTRPYAGWLRPRMDYFDVADELLVDIPAPKVEPGKPPPKRPNPTPVQERRAWTVQVAKAPVSRGAAAWVPRLKPLFSQEGVPTELVWLAEVESDFNPEAQSPVGAVGLYQLMPATAQSLGLKLRPDDERKDAEKNARTAAAYLRYLFLKFRDWRLTVAAYNAGEGRVRETMRSGGKSFDDISRRLPAETQMYVPKLEAVLRRQEQKSLLQLPAARP